MKTRILTGLVIGPLLMVLCFFSGTVALPVTVAILSLIGTVEMLKCTGVDRDPWVTVPAIVLSLCSSAFACFFDRIEDFALGYMAAMFCYIIFLFTVSILSKGKIPVDDVFSSFASIVYVTFAFSSLVLLRGRDGGGYLLVMAIFMPLISDIFAYFTGVFFGRHKLIPEVSPKKTIEGSLGGMFFCGVGCVVFAIVVANMNGDPIGFMLGLRMFVIGLIVSVISQVGDLLASVIKRRYGIKDYGKLFPGHGGVLDRFDSVLAVSPIILFLTFIPSFVIFTA